MSLWICVDQEDLPLPWLPTWTALSRLVARVISRLHPPG